MSKNCRIEFVEGELTCLCNHRDYRNCDLYKDDEETYEGWGGGRMRELKFRSYTGRCFVFLDLNNDNDFTFNEFCSCLGDSSIEQYTGLKDKNGKEIYEGDIVTLNGEWEEIEHGDYSIVTFENGCFRVGNGYENETGSYLSDW